MPVHWLRNRPNLALVLRCRALPTLALALVSLTVVSCGIRCPPGPKCYSGVVVGDACLNGLLIEVDAATPVDKSAGSFGTNVVAAVNFEAFAGPNQPGQRVYFMYRTEPTRQAPSRVCTAITVPLAVPHVVASNLPATSCSDNKCE